MKVVSIKPKRFAAQMKALPGAVRKGMRRAAEEAKRADFDATVATWEHAVEFVVEEQAGGSFRIYTTDPVWNMVNDGTRPHVIVAKPGKMLRFGVGGRPKTTPRRIKASAGAPGSTVVIRPRVNHPGTEARDFTGLIAKRWIQHLAPFVRAAIKEALR